MSAPIQDVEEAQKNTQASSPPAGESLKFQLILAIVVLLTAATPGIVSIIQANAQGSEISELKDLVEGAQALIEELEAKLKDAETTADGIEIDLTTLQQDVNELKAAELIKTFANLTIESEFLDEQIQSYTETIEEAGNTTFRFNALEDLVFPAPQKSITDAAVEVPSTVSQIGATDFEFGFGPDVTDFTAFVNIVTSIPDRNTIPGIILQDDSQGGADTPYVMRATDPNDDFAFGLANEDHRPVPAGYFGMHEHNIVEKGVVMARHLVKKAGLVDIRCHSLALNYGKAKIQLILLRNGQSFLIGEEHVEQDVTELNVAINDFNVFVGDYIVLAQTESDDGYAGDATASKLVITFKQPGA